MAEFIIQSIVKLHSDRAAIIKWLDSSTEQPHQDFECTREEFASFFLNYIHEEAAKGGTEVNQLDESRENARADESPRSPPEAFGSQQVKTPDYRRSSVSPLYRNADVTPRREKTDKTPRSQKPLRFGDFVVAQHSKQKKKRNGKSDNTPSAEKAKRINPTKLEFHSDRVVNSIDNSFDFKETCSDFSRITLVEERHTIWAKQSPMKIKLNGVTAKETGIKQVTPDKTKVTKIELLDVLIEIYSCILDMNIANTDREMVFLMNLLFYTHHEGGVFESVHNVVYFATHTIEKRKNILDNYDKPTLSLLSKNKAMINFTPQLVEEIANMSMLKTERRLEAFPGTKTVCFDSEMDNRSNFTTVNSFNAWRKQRDMFYQILKIWTDKHHDHGFNYAQLLGGKINTLLGLHLDPTNMVRFAMLFLKQLLSCSSMENMDGLAQLPIDSEKLSLLASRLETKRMGAAPGGFVGREEFYRDFIVSAGNQAFTRHLFDAIVCEIADLNETKFMLEENITDTSNRNAYHACIKSLRTLAKFLGFIEALPYKNPYADDTVTQAYPEAIMAHMLRIRQVTTPSFDCHKYLLEAMLDKRLVLVVPWLTKYLNMLDHVTLSLPYYRTVLQILFEIHKNFRSKAERNAILIRGSLNTLFELPHVSDLYTAWCKSNSTCPDLSNNGTGSLCSLDNSDIVDQNVLYMCCPYMERIKDILLSNSKKGFAKHITPVSTSLKVAAQPNNHGQYCAESFLNSQSTSIRKTVAFLTDRLSSSSVKYICGCAPEYEARYIASVNKSILPDKPPCYRTAFKDFRAELLGDVTTDLEVRIKTTVSALLSMEELPDVKRAVYWIVRTKCLEAVEGWMNSHFNEHTFTYYCENQARKLISVDEEQKLVFALPPSGIPGLSSTSECLSAENILHKIRLLYCDCLEKSRTIKSSEFETLLESTYMTLTTRCDINQCIKSTIYKTLMDLLVSAMAYNPTVISKKTYKWVEDILKLARVNGYPELHSLICRRNMNLLCNSTDPRSAVSSFAEFCFKLIANGQLDAELFGRKTEMLFCGDGWCERDINLISQFERAVLDKDQHRTQNSSVLMGHILYTSDIEHFKEKYEEKIADAL